MTFSIETTEGSFLANGRLHLFAESSLPSRLSCLMNQSKALSTIEVRHVFVSVSLNVDTMTS